MAETRTNVLLVDDDIDFGVLVSASLRSARLGAYQVRQVELLSEALAAVNGSVDVVLLDLGLPDSHGLASVTRLRAAAPMLPVIILTGHDDDQLALQAVREGAQDYLVKSQVDAQVLPRAIRYAIERKRGQESLRRSEEFFRLISENVTDLIAVVDSAGRRLYNSPSYAALLGDPADLKGTDSFAEIHPDDRDRIRRLFAETLATGVGQPAEYRLMTRQGIRNIESQGSLIVDPAGKSPRLVIVSRDITERRQTIGVLRQALADLNETHEELRSTQRQLIAAERIQAVSTFAAGVAHEVRNPLQTIILGIDYLTGQTPEETSTMVLREMAEAVQRADAIIRGLLEFASVTKPDVREEDLNAIVEHAIATIQPDLTQYPVQFAQRLAPDLPLVKVEVRVVKHVLINLLLYALRAFDGGGRLTISTSTRTWQGLQPGATGGFSQLTPGDELVVAQVECTFHQEEGGATRQPADKTGGKSAGLGLTVLKKIIELYGGAIEATTRKGLGRTYSVMFRVQQESKNEKENTGD